MRKIYLNIWSLTKKTVSSFIDGDSFSYAASIAFSTIFSLPAILLIALSIGSAFYEQKAVQQQLIDQVGALIGKQSTLEIQRVFSNASMEMSSKLARVIGIGTLIFSATTVFVSLQFSINKMWGIKPKPQKEWLRYIVNRLLSFAMVASLGFILLVSLIVDTILMAFQKVIAHYFEGISAFILVALNLIISLGIITVVFALLFKVLPDAKIRWRDVWIGALITTFLFTIGKYLIGLYLGNSSINSAYGAAGSFVVFLIWVYYSTVIFLLGAQFTFVHAAASGRPIEPTERAVRFVITEIPSGKDI